MTHPVDIVKYSHPPSSLHADVASYRTAKEVEPAINVQSTPRAGMRRLKAETTPQPKFLAAPPATSSEAMEKQFQTLFTRLNYSIERGHYHTALSILAKIHALWVAESGLILNEHLVPYYADLIWGIHLLEKGLYEVMQAYLFSLTKNPEAMALCDSGFEKIGQAVQELKKTIPHEHLGMGEEEWQTLFNSLCHFCLGMIELSFPDYKDKAAADLKIGFQYLLDNKGSLASWNNLEFLLLIKALEQKLGASLLAVPVEEGKPLTYFIGGRYEECLAWIDQHPDESDSDIARAACYAMTGRYEEALRLFDPSTSHNDEIVPLIHYLKGDMEEARRTAFAKSYNQPLGYLLLLVIEASSN